MGYVYAGCGGVVGGAWGLGVAMAHRSGTGEAVAFLVIVAAAVAWRRGSDALRRVW